MSYEGSSVVINADYVLPCDVRLDPATIIRKGCKLSTLMAAFKVREHGWPEVTAPDTQGGGYGEKDDEIKAVLDAAQSAQHD